MGLWVPFFSNQGGGGGGGGVLISLPRLTGGQIGGIGKIKDGVSVLEPMEHSV